MEFPSFHFPYLLNPRQKKRELFADFGVHSNLEFVRNSSNLCTFFEQKCHLGSTGGSQARRYCANFPSIPLSKKPVCVPYPYEDKINGSLVKERKELLQFIASVKRQRAHRYHGGQLIKNAHYFDLCDVLTDLEDNHGDVSAIEIPEWLSKQYTIYKNYRHKTNIPTYNSEYCGGCVKYLGRSAEDNTHLVLKTTGAQFDQIDVREGDDDLLSIDRFNTLTSETTLYQLDAKLGFCVARKAQECILVSVKSTNESFPLCVEKSSGTNIDGILTDVCLSPYISGECLISTDEGTFYHWTAEDSLDALLKEKPHRFACDDNWRSCHYGGHPRQIVAVDRTVMELYDIRGPSRTGVDLFALPSQHLDTKERIMVTKHHPANVFHHLVATDYSLIMIDERFPNNPILQWNHVLQYPPQYISVLEDINAEPREDLIVLASQKPAETCCFQLTNEQRMPPQSACSQWKLCKLGDFFQFCDYPFGTDKAVIKERFNTSLSGIETFHLESEDSFVTLQMDSYGEIFYQIYSQTTEDADKTFSSGPGSLKAEVPDYVAPSAMSWIAGLHQDLDEKIKAIVASRIECNVDASDLYQKILLQRQPHVLCNICMLDLDSDEKEYHEEISDFCLRCNLSIQEGGEIIDSVMKDEIIKQDLPDCFALNSRHPVADEYSHDVIQTKILIKTWNGETDVTDLLKAKDEERRKQKDLKQNKKKVDQLLSLNTSDGNELDKTSEYSDFDSQITESDAPDKSGSDVHLVNEYTVLKPTLFTSTPNKSVSQEVRRRCRQQSRETTPPIAHRLRSRCSYSTEQSETPNRLENRMSVSEGEQDSQGIHSLTDQNTSTESVHSVVSFKRRRHSSGSSVFSKQSQKSVLSETCFQNLPSWITPTKKSRLTDNTKASSSKAKFDRDDTSDDDDETLFDQSGDLFSSTFPSSYTLNKSFNAPSKKPLLLSASQPVGMTNFSPVKKKHKKFVSGF